MEGKEMKVIAFNGSPRLNGNTFTLINSVFNVLNNEGIETELINITTKPIRGCKACNKCREYKNKKCVINNDLLNEYIDKMIEADGIILGSPVFFSNVTSEMKALIDRAGYVAKVNDDLFKRKVGASVISVRRAGATSVFSDINYFFLINQMIVPGSSYWNLGVGLDKGEVNNDTEGLQTMEKLGENMAWLLKKIN